ncbi:MAG: AMP-binding protein [Ilumatobacteraceae bacterium]
MTAAGIQFGDEFTARETIYDRGARAARGLASLGVGRGDVVATFLRNDVTMYEAAIATATLGALVVPVNWHFKRDEARYVLEDSGARVLVAHCDLLASIEGGVPEDVTVISVPTVPSRRATSNAPCPAPGTEEWGPWLARFDPWVEPPQTPEFSMNYTSGTTGQPKGVRRAPLSDEGRAAMATMFQQLRVGPGMRTIVAAPVYHAAPFGFSMAALAAGGFLALMDRFDPEEYLATIERFRINNVQMVPTMFVRLLKLPHEARGRYDVSSLELVSHGAAPCPPEVKQAMIEWWGPIIYEFYAASELGLIATFVTSEEALAHPGTVGRPVEGAVIRVLDDDGNEVPAGTVGEIAMWIRGTSPFTYHGNDEKRQGIQRGDLVTCGDMGYLDDEGYLYLTDRKSDMVIVGGANVYPAEIEHVLIGMPGVLDCAVFGIPDEDLGEVLAAVVQPQSGAQLSGEAVQAWLSERVARMKVPTVVEIRDELPREDTGKLFKRKLKQEFAARTRR